MLESKFKALPDMSHHSKWAAIQPEKLFLNAIFFSFFPYYSKEDIFEKQTGLRSCMYA